MDVGFHNSCVFSRLVAPSACVLWMWDSIVFLIVPFSVCLNVLIRLAFLLLDTYATSLLNLFVWCPVTLIRFTQNLLSFVR